MGFEEPFGLDLGEAGALTGTVEEGALENDPLVVRVDEDGRIDGRSIDRLEVRARHVGHRLRDVYERGWVMVHGHAIPADDSEPIGFIGSLRIAGDGPIFSAVVSLEGLRMWGSRRAVDMEMFAFGRRTRRRGRDGSEHEVGDFALHLQCAWGIWHDGRTVVGYADGFDSMSTEEGDRDRLLRELFERERLVVLNVESGSDGHLLIRFENYAELEVLPDRGLRHGDPAENWRFFAPGGDSHLVCYSDGFRIE